MQLFFVIDSVENLDDKLERAKNIFDCKPSFFIKTSLYTKVSTNLEIMQSLLGVYDKNVNAKINEYIHGSKYNLDDCLVLYASADLTNEFLLELKNKITYGYDAIFIKEKETFFSKLKDKLYTSIIKLMFNVEDKKCSVKAQYLKRTSMEKLLDARFNDRILMDGNTTTMYTPGKNKTLSEKPKFEKKTILALIVGCVIILMYVVLEVFLKLPFFVIFTFILLTFLSVIVSIMLFVNNIFKSRYGEIN